MNPAIATKVAGAIEALDILADSADNLRLFELHAIANAAFFKLDGYVTERADSPAPPVCANCDAGYHESPVACACACHQAAPKMGPGTAGAPQRIERTA